MVTEVPIEIGYLIATAVVEVVLLVLYIVECWAFDCISTLEDELENRTPHKANEGTDNA